MGALSARPLGKLFAQLCELFVPAALLYPGRLLCAPSDRLSSEQTQCAAAVKPLALRRPSSSDDSVAIMRSSLCLASCAFLVFVSVVTRVNTPPFPSWTN